MVARYRSATERFTGRIRVGVSVFFALIAGLGVSSQWKEWMLFTHRVDFGQTDPQFHKDIGFYVFQLPFIRFIIDWLFAGLVIVLLVTAVAYYLNGGIRFQSATQRVSPAREGAPLGDPRGDGAGEDGRVLLRSLRAQLLHRRRGRRRGLHAGESRAPRAQPAHLHLDRGRGAVPLEHLAARLGAADHRGGAVGVRVDRGRHDLSRRWCSSSG